MNANIFLALVPFFILILFYFFWRINQLEKYLIKRREEEEQEMTELKTALSELQDAFDAELVEHHG